MNSIRCWAHSVEILVYVVIISSFNSCNFRSMLMLEISCSNTTQRCLIGLRPGTGRGHWKGTGRTLNSLTCHETSEMNFCYVTWNIVMLEVARRKWYIVAMKECTCSAWLPQRTVALFGMKCVPRKHPYTITSPPPAQPVDTRQVGTILFSFVLLLLNSDSTIDHTSLRLSCLPILVFWRSSAHRSLSLCSWLTEVEPDVVFSCCSPSIWDEIFCAF